MSVDNPQNLLETFNQEMTSSPETDSVHNYLEHIIGEPTSKTLSIAGAGPTSLDCFVITGSVKILELWLDITAVGNSNDFSDVQFDLFPAGGLAIDITDTVGGSGCLVGWQFVKMEGTGVALEAIDNTLGAVTEGSSGPPQRTGLFTHFIATKKTGVATNVRLTFNGDGATDITGTVHCRWHKVSADANLAAAA